MQKGVNMNKYVRKIITIILAGTVSVFCGCAASEQAPPSDAQQDVSESDTESDKTPEPAEADSLGEFTMQDIYGETYTNEMFSDYNLTMVNVFTTWCTPCINEIPDLDKLHTQMKEQGVSVVGIVLDAAASDDFGAEDEKSAKEAVEKAKILAEQTNVSYPFLIPDEGMLNGRLNGIEAVPETFFADKDGNITGGTYPGSRSLEDWKEVVETELGNLK